MLSFVCHIIVFTEKNKAMDTFLLIKYLKCKATPEEEEAVRHWLANDPDGSHAKQYSDAHFMYEGMLIHGQDEVRKPVSSRSGFRRLLVVMTSCAASVAIAVLAGMWSRNRTLDSVASRMETVYVPAGKVMQLTLEDGTRLWLNSGTEIEYPAVFSRKSRNVKVNSGEVMFDVTPDVKRPFLVDTYASEISVLGTKFNVAVDEPSGEFSVALLRGAVKVESKLKPSEDYVMAPNQIVRMRDSHLYMENIDNTDAVECWTKGLIDITGIPFDQLMRKFELLFGVDIRIERETVPVIRYTRGKVRVADGIDHALTMLSLAADFKYDYDRVKNVVVIK